ncbi:uncharacterized protein RSE6_07445 [Rhynchosporium secalis]|uniref:Uncharacterized protein n=1 Tax=Rhynchosporium secalis TaxID=38038 RepID=A0A1E1MCU5_RHYSE|nr:uncharacterized protein RSE6_07445 [Rhynchosporium secalis]
MFKWHVSSAIGRSRPAAHDLARVTDGIAASLRQFSISASRSAQEDDSGDKLRITRQYSNPDILNEVSSLAPNPSRGIDARSLAARPPQQFTRREDSRFAPRGGSSFAPRVAFRGPNPASSRDGGRGGARGRGGIRGRGRGRGKGRGAKRNRRGGDRGPREKTEDEGAPIPMTPEELKYYDDRMGGFQAPYKPITSAEDLARWGPPVISSPRGVLESLVYKMAVATDNVSPEFKSASDHHAKMMSGAGTLFENAEERRRSKGVYRKAGKLSKDDKQALMKQWVAGRYECPQDVANPGDVLAQVSALTRRNETYLPADGKKFEDTLRKLLPANLRDPNPQQAAKRRN